MTTIAESQDKRHILVETNDGKGYIEDRQSGEKTEEKGIVALLSANIDWEDEEEEKLEKQDGSNLTEFDVNLQEVDFKQRAFLKELLNYKKQIRVELEKEDLDVLVQERLEQALEIIQHTISLHRFSGW
ncbi:MAG: hypothetical protein AABX79_00020 [Nanoarchaeota archaeon]